MDSEQLLLPTSFNLASLDSEEVDAAGDSAGSRGHSPARKDGHDSSLDIPTANMDTVVQCHTTENPQRHGESSVVIADSKNAGALQQVMITAVKTPRRRNRVPVNLKLVQNCKCLACGFRRYNRDIIPDRLAFKDKAHSWIELCENTECDSRYGIRRVPDTEHLFNAPNCHGRNLSCRCVAGACNFVSGRRNDLRRHHAAKHCIKPERYPCPEPFCVHGGENGFKRPDKLKDHHRKVHEGKLRPVQVQRPIQSAGAKPALEWDLGRE